MARHIAEHPFLPACRRLKSRGLTKLAKTPHFMPQAVYLQTPSEAKGLVYPEAKVDLRDTSCMPGRGNAKGVTRKVEHKLKELTEGSGLGC